VLDGIVLRGHAKGIIAHRLGNFIAFHHFQTGDSVSDRVIGRVADMEHSGWIGEHVQNVKFRFATGIFGFESLVITPVFLPLELDFSEIILHSLYKI